MDKVNNIFDRAAKLKAMMESSLSPEGSSAWDELHGPFHVPKEATMPEVAEKPPNDELDDLDVDLSSDEKPRQENKDPNRGGFNRQLTDL